VVVLGYSLAKVSGLPTPAVLATLVQDTATTQKLAEELAASAFLAPQFASMVSIGFAPVSVTDADDAILQLTGGAGDQHFFAPIGEYCALGSERLVQQDSCCLLRWLNSGWRVTEPLKSCVLDMSMYMGSTTLVNNAWGMANCHRGNDWMI
jgi:hypothetical protein